MTNLTPVSSLDSVVEHPTTQLLLAGPGGPLNQQAQQLLNRTKFLDDARISQASQIAALQTFDADLGSNTDPLKGSTKVGFPDQLSAAFLQTVSDIINGSDVSIFRFIDKAKHAGIRARTNTDDLLADFNDAMVCGARKIRVPYGLFNVGGTINVSQDGFKFVGDGPDASTIKSLVNNLPVIKTSASRTNLEIGGFSIDRAVTAIAGGNGVDFGAIGSFLHLHDIVVQAQNVGVVLGGTDYSKMERVISQKNLSHGVLMRNDPTLNALQWSVLGCLSSRNAGSGFLVTAVAGPAAVALGSWVNIATFANQSFGVAVIGLPGTPINGVRLSGDSFLGEDGNSELYMDTYGGLHEIMGSFFELCGQSPTGPTLAVPASLIGSGIEITANNSEVSLKGCRTSNNSLDGVITSATVATTFNSMTSTNNGLALSAGRRNGFYNLGTGRASFIGCRSGNLLGNTSQLFGIVGSDGSKILEVGNDLVGNTTAPSSFTANGTAVTAMGNLPSTENTIIQGAVAVGAPTGGASITGGINVATNIAKNNVVYTNP